MEHCKVNCEDFPSSEDLGGLRGENPASLIFIAVSNRLAGAISYQDALRPESRQVIEGLKARGVETSMLISGDSKNVVCQVSQTLGIEDYYGETFPQEKSRIISRLKTKGFMTVMVGDGINDGPALAVSDVGISMKESSDVARETADVVLLNNNLTGLLDLLDISRQTMIRLRECSRMILIPSVAAMGLAVPGLIGPGMATFVNDGAAVLACIHAVRAGMKEA
ncbi:MAG TPA: HAD family hydrolase [Desulfobacterales bacterium]|nr:HAD family hydrolase [Desulfobacterales bacterium]